MASTINAKTTGVGGIEASGDASGVLALQTGGTTAVTIDASQNVGIGTSVNTVYDGVAQPRPLVVQSASTATGQYNSTNALVICNSDTTTNNASQLNFAAITGASTNQYTSAVISCIYGARTNTIYPSGTLTFATAPATQAPLERMRIDSSGQQSSTIVGFSGTYTEYKCRAWIYFDGSIATPSIKGSGNISSITDNGTGDYTLNFTTAMPDVNYAYNITNDSGGSNSVRYSCTTTISAGSLRFTTRFLSSIGSGPVEDQNYVRVSIFR